MVIRGAIYKRRENRGWHKKKKKNPPWVPAWRTDTIVYWHHLVDISGEWKELPQQRKDHLNKHMNNTHQCLLCEGEIKGSQFWSLCWFCTRGCWFEMISNVHIIEKHRRHVRVELPSLQGNLEAPTRPHNYTNHYSSSQHNLWLTKDEFQLTGNQKSLDSN